MVTRRVVVVVATSFVVACSASYGASEEPEPDPNGGVTKPPSGKGPPPDAATEVPECTDECPKDGATECSAGGVATFRVCETTARGCRVWKVVACKDGITSCEKAPAACIGTCPPAPCTAGSTQCSGPDKFKTCARGVDGCLAWTEAASCVRTLPSPGCFAYPKACAGQCDACKTQGSIICTGPSSYQKCVADTSTQCLGWKTGNCASGTSVCFSSPQACAQ